MSNPPGSFVVVSNRSGSHGEGRLFTQNIQRHVECLEIKAGGGSVREVLDNIFAGNPQARSDVLDDQNALRRYMTIFVDGHAVRDRTRVCDPVAPGSTICVFQVLSGG